MRLNVFLLSISASLMMSFFFLFSLRHYFMSIFLPVSIILLRSFSSLWKIIEAYFLTSFFFLHRTFFCRSTPSHFLFFSRSIVSNYFYVSMHMIEMREINCIIFLYRTYPMADLLSSDHSLQQSLIVDETMWIDHLLYVDD